MRGEPRLFDRINRQDIRLGTPWDTDEPFTEPTGDPADEWAYRTFRSVVRSSVRVTADECALWVRHLYKTNQEKGWRPEDMPLRLPFDSMWIEWGYPLEIAGNNNRTYAAWAKAIPPGPEDPPGTVQVISLLLFMSKSPTAAWCYVFPAYLQLQVGEHGACVGSTVQAFTSDNEQARERAQLILPILTPSWLAVGLMNCRNVKIDELEPAPTKNTGRQKRRSAKPMARPLNHHIITLPGRDRPTTSASAAAAGGGTAPLHIVRGHFKTYTTDAPLLGKYVGTYWWQPAARGDRANGITDTSYRIRSPRPTADVDSGTAAPPDRRTQPARGRSEFEAQ